MGVALFDGILKGARDELFLHSATFEIGRDHQLDDRKYLRALGRGGDGALLLGDAEAYEGILFAAVAEAEKFIFKASHRSLCDPAANIAFNLTEPHFDKPFAAALALYHAFILRALFLLRHMIAHTEIIAIILAGIRTAE